MSKIVLRPYFRLLDLLSILTVLGILGFVTYATFPNPLFILFAILIKFFINFIFQKIEFDFNQNKIDINFGPLKRISIDENQVVEWKFQKIKHNFVRGGNIWSVFLVLRLVDGKEYRFYTPKHIKNDVQNAIEKILQKPSSDFALNNLFWFEDFKSIFY